MSGWLVIPLAFILDCVLGDPQWVLHPVRLIGALAQFIENFIYQRFAVKLHKRHLPQQSPRPCISLFLGAISWAAVILVTIGAGFFVMAVITKLAFLFALLLKIDARTPVFVARIIGQVFLVYISIAPRDMAKHARKVRIALEKEGLERGRQAVSMIVGRDVNRLDREGVIRAAIESTAESTIDGVIAPLFWAMVIGPIAALAYRAI
ncbi:MAG: cobalamin biosynthesis protein, partial [Anaerolineales bacterium]